MSGLYQQRFTMHARLAKGGYMRTYDIVRAGKVIGHKSIVRQSRKEDECVTYVLGERTFITAREFIAAYEATLSAPKEGEAA